jgi:hypothetical protein
MPLRALVDGVDIVAPVVSDLAWSRICSDARGKRSEIRMVCCGALGRPRVSSSGLRHFYHRPGVGRCEWAAESVPHLSAKASIAVAASSLGFRVETEAVGDGWRADVLVSDGPKKIVFEVQYSRQGVEDYDERSERYARDGANVCWLVRHSDALAKWVGVVAPFDAFGLAVGDGASLSVDTSGLGGSVGMGSRLRPIDTFVTAYLSDRLRRVATFVQLLEPDAVVRFFATRCGWCQSPCHMYYVDAHWLASCSCFPIRDVRGPRHDGTAAWLEFDSDVMRVARSFADSVQGLRLGVVVSSYGGYMFTCPTCSRLYRGRDYLRDVLNYARTHFPVVAEVPVRLERMVRERSLLRSEYSVLHWCEVS